MDRKTFALLMLLLIVLASRKSSHPSSLFMNCLILLTTEYCSCFFNYSLSSFDLCMGPAGQRIKWWWKQREEYASHRAMGSRVHAAVITIVLLCAGMRVSPVADAVVSAVVAFALSSVLPPPPLLLIEFDTVLCLSIARGHMIHAQHHHYH